jgi:hypothetical protein
MVSSLGFKSYFNLNLFLVTDLQGYFSASLTSKKKATNSEKEQQVNVVITWSGGVG